METFTEFANFQANSNRCSQASDTFSKEHDRGATECAGRRLLVFGFLKKMQMEISTPCQSPRAKVFLLFLDVSFLSMVFQSSYSFK
ncbi:MAG: hypothetical protein C0469_14475 [Cyanobacteria bacterium DS2.3.42]|nr:hypothetical protein [Cyanobacteria bacterium DS2.3.42]